MCCIIKENVMSMEVPGYMRVRAYLYNLAEHATEKSPKIPSENTLCRMFGVSRMTVRSAIKGLIQTQVLQTRRGVGTFVNTEFTQKATVRLPLVGLLQDSGRNVYSTISPAVRTAVIESGMIPELVVLPDSASAGGRPGNLSRPGGGIRYAGDLPCRTRKAARLVFPGKRT